MFDREGQEAGAPPARPLVARLVPWATAPVPVLLVAIGALWYLGVDASFESRTLLAVLNFALVTCTSVAIALLAGRTFVATGMPGTLFLGAGVLLMGAAFLVAPVAGMRAPNVVATVHNIGMLAAGVLSLVGAWMSSRPRAPVRAPRPALLGAYAGALVLVAGVAYLALEGATPPFFVQGAGGTPLRQVVVATGAGTFCIAGLVLVLAQGIATTFRRWYALGLVLVGVGLVGVMLQHTLGSPIGWVGRIAQYLGSVYLLVASVTSATEARRWSLPLEAELRAERTQAGELREARERLARVLEGSNDGHWEWNIATGRADFSDRWAEILGYRRSELAPSISTWQGMVHPDDREEARGNQKRIARGELDRYDVDRRLRHKDGHWVWVHVRGKVVERDGDGNPTRMAGTYTDISARKAAELALREVKERLSLVLDGSGDGFWDWDVPTGRVKFSRRWASMLGYDLDELPQDVATWKGLVHPDDLGLVMDQVEAHLRGDTGQYETEHRVRHKDGRWVWVLDRGRVVARDDEGKPLRMVGTHTDVTERKRLEATVVEARLEAERRARELQAVLDAVPAAIYITREASARHVATNRFGAGLMTVPDAASGSTGLPEGQHPSGFKETKDGLEPLNARLPVQVAAAQGVEVRNYELDLVTADGTARHLLGNASPLRDEAGQPAGAVGAFIDVTALHEAERRVRDSERRLKELLEMLPVAAFVDRADRIEEPNRAALALFGATRPEQVVGKGKADFMPPPSVAAAREEVARGLAGQTPVSKEVEVIGLDGVHRTAQAFGAPIEDDSGRAVHVILADVTEHRRMEAELEASHAQLQLHVANTPLALVEWDGGYRVTRFSPRAEVMFGWTAAEVVGKRIDEVPWVPEEDWPVVRDVMRHMDDGSRPNNVSLNRNRRKDGRIIHCEWYNSTLRGPDGKLVSVFSLVQDVTSREEARAALQVSETRFRALAEGAPVGIYETDPAGGIVYVNAMAQRLLGQTLDEARGLGALPAIHPEDRERVLRTWMETVAAGRRYRSDHRFVQRGGAVVSVSVHAAPVRDGRGQVTGYVGVMVDVTEQRSLQHQVEVSARLAALGTLVAGLAHEINNPLTAQVAGQGLALEVARHARQQLLSGAPVDPSVNVRELDGVVEALEDAQEAGQRVARIVRDMAAFARPGATYSRVRLRDVVDQGLRWVIGPRAGAARVEVEDHGATDVMGSPGQLAQVVQNLVSNALRAVPPGTPGAVVTVRLGADEAGRATLEVVDTGVGIAPEVLGRVFEPFFTTRPAGEGRGTGLGLSVCHSIVTAHEGTITVESQVGKGSTFQVRLPAAPDAPRADPVTA